MYCKYCGSSIPDSSAFCPVCGKAQNAPLPPAPIDSGSAGWGVLGFFFPIVGFILWLVWRTDRPRSARSAGIGTLVGVIVEVLASVLYAVLFFGVLGSVLGAAAGQLSSVSLLVL